MTTQRRGSRVALNTGIVLLLLVVLSGITWRNELLALYLFRRDFQRLDSKTHGLPEYLHRRTGIVFVEVPGGTFWMGSPDAAIGRTEDEGPVHEVRLTSFLIAKHEVSQEQWGTVMGSWRVGFAGDNLPVEMVSWEDCKEFCRRSGLALPSEAEWEYACRAGTRTPFAFGESVALDQVNCYGSAANGKWRRRSVGVDSFEPNEWGLYNMHGNVSEWCEDSYVGSFYSNSKPEQNPVCLSVSLHRVARGGSWLVDATECRSASRAGIRPSFRAPVIGFRPVKRRL